MEFVEKNVFTHNDVANLFFLSNNDELSIIFRDNTNYKINLLDVRSRKIIYTFKDEKVLSAYYSIYNGFFYIAINTLKDGSKLIKMNKDLKEIDTLLSFNNNVNLNLFKNSDKLFWTDGIYTYINRNNNVEKILSNKISYSNALTEKKDILVYRDTVVNKDGKKFGKYIIFNNDALKINTFGFGIYDFKVVSFNNSFIIIYRDGLNKHYGSFVQLSLDGEVKKRGVFNNTATYDSDIMVKNNHIYICFRDGGNSNQGTLFKFNDKFELISKLIFDKQSSTMMSMCFSKNYIYITYRNVNGNGTLIRIKD